MKNKKVRNNKKEPSFRDKREWRLKDNKSNAAANKKEITVTPKNYPQLSLERTVVFNAKTGITNVSTEVRRKCYFLLVQ